jgi:hypothetical protein
LHSHHNIHYRAPFGNFAEGWWAYDGGAPHLHGGFRNWHVTW